MICMLGCDMFVVCSSIATLAAKEAYIYCFLLPAYVETCGLDGEYVAGIIDQKGIDCTVPEPEPEPVPEPEPEPAPTPGE